MKLNLRIIGTGSSGNCYLFYNDEISFVIDAGVSIKKHMHLIPDFSKFKGIFITHEHVDHAKFCKEAISLGIDLFMTEGTRESLSFDKKELNSVKVIKQTKTIRLTDNVSITPFHVKHNANDPCGFLIKHYGDATMFATDCNYIYAKFNYVNNFIIEANHSLSMMEKNNINYNAFTNHMSVENSIKFVKENMSSVTKNVIFIHMSERNCTEDYILDKSKCLINKNINVYVGKRNTNIRI